MNIITPIGDDGSIRRSAMPQVNKEDLGELLVFLGRNGVGCSAGVVDPASCKAHQKINVERAMAITPEDLRQPSLVSQDFWIIDGDHRWYRHGVDKTLMPFIMILLPFADAVNHVKRFPKTYEERKA